ncbi:MAG: 4Fe-4S dicluster domain-containing protein [Bryobacterales bacterium]
MRTGQVETLVILGANPVYASPPSAGFAEALNQVPNRIHLGLFPDETAECCNWRLPATHALEHWSDARTFDGSASVIQPLIEPLYEGRSPHQVLAALSGDFLASGQALVQDYWRRNHQGEDFERWWRQGLYRGVLEGTSFEPETVEPMAAPVPPESAPNKDAGIELSFAPDPTIYDGRFAENAWLQELPKPVLSLTWDNAAYMSEATAKRLGVWNEDTVEISVGDRSVEAPVWVTPGHADDAITLHLGYGRESAGEVRGFNAYELLPLDGGWSAIGAELRKLGRRWPLADRQTHQQMENRDLAVSVPLDRYQSDPSFVTQIHPPPEADNTLLPPWKYDGYKWGMAIDLSACMGCGACTLACQAENNIPVVGKEAVINNRAMHWIRVDYYFQGSPAAPEIIPQPVPCMHCENAPCELVCPVGATVHSGEGLNQMVYNRCVGTRYCSNNCPYKVRRFNFLDFSGFQPESYDGRMNPDVTVRRRGVMEKCTYCVQRIEEARITAGKEDRKIRDGEIVTACQQVCPTEAIVFGDLNDPGSRVSTAKRSQRDYGLLLELNTKPRTSYAARLKNRNDASDDGES